jgi:MoaA/NifB/PqqE/SkfB family radical SAM enzyme
MAFPPRFLFLQINKRCNLRCQHCDFWQENDDDKANYLPWARKREIIDEFAALNPAGAVVICGGESMLDIDDYFAVTTECRRLGLKAVSVINGTRVRSAAMADRMIDEGPHEISISLNSHRADQHDETRGVKGSFDKAVRAIRLLLEARGRRPGSSARIYVMGLIYDENYREIESFYDFVLNELGADKLKLNFLQPSFGHGAPTDDFFLKHHRIDPDELVAIIRRCDARFGLGLNPAWLANVHMYFRSLQNGSDVHRGWQAESMTEAHICNTYERNIMVDHYGGARLCFSTAFRSSPLERYGDLKRFWLGSDDIRGEMRQCNRFCGISHSVRRESSTRQGMAAASAALPPIGRDWSIRNSLNAFLEAYRSG